jgi:hypothetical protein
MYIQMQTPGGTIWAEVEDTETVGGLERAAGSPQVFQTFEEVVKALKENAKFLQDTLLDLAPDEVEVSFAIKAGAEAGVPLFGLAKATGEGSYTVTLKWKTPDKG